MKSVYEIITDRIIAELEKETVPWKKKWKASGFPKNLVSKREYRGVNTMILSMTSYSSPYFATIKQVNQLGGRVRKGEKGFPIIFWKYQEAKESLEVVFASQEDTVDEPRSAPILRYYTVFNVEQCQGLNGAIPEEVTISFDPIDECEKVVSGYTNRPEIKHMNGVACYKPLMDSLLMPKPESFETPENYYGTLFHELVHSTGHEKRLGREEIKTLSVYGDHKYSREELIAEIGASFLCNRTHIDIAHVFDNQVSYIGSWLKVLKDDKRMIVYASAKAQKAVDYILKNEDKTEPPSTIP